MLAIQALEDDTIGQGVSETQVSETAKSVSLTQVSTTAETITQSITTAIVTNAIKETSTMSVSTNKTSTTNVPTTKVLKYVVVGTDTREHIAQRMKNYDKYHYFFMDNPQIYVISFAYNNEKLKEKYGDDFDILTGGGNAGTFYGPYAGRGYWDRKGKKVEEGSYVEYIVKKGAHPLTGEVWWFEISFIAQEGWRIDKYYFDQEYTDYNRELWKK
ncbi:MAG: hypothetical protein LBT44_01115 [Clostridiales bacterium]|jgi:hypothetical protein|nr:hypothetical protein [Clostridiales bacterium]